MVVDSAAGAAAPEGPIDQLKLYVGSLSWGVDDESLQQSSRSSVPARSCGLGMIGIPCLRAYALLLRDPCTCLRGVLLCFLVLCHQLPRPLQLRGPSQDLLV